MLSVGASSSERRPEQARSHIRSSVHTVFVYEENQLWERAFSGRRSDDDGSPANNNLDLLRHPRRQQLQGAAGIGRDFFLVEMRLLVDAFDIGFGLVIVV